MKTVYIKIDASSLKLVSISNTRYNPGIGGTEFSSLRLAYQLNSAGIDVKVVSDTISTDNVIDGLKVITWKEFQLSKLGVCIIPTKYQSLEFDPGHRVIWWSHHPHERPNEKYHEVVCLSDYQRLSNANLTSSKRIACVRNFPSFILKTHSRFNITGNYGIFMGALSPGKGFLEAVPYFNSLLQKGILNEVKVIGGDLYQSGENSHYMSKITTAMKTWKNQYQFLGVLGHEKLEVIRNARLAIFNPTGKTEAYPATPLEILNEGIICFGGNDYGSTEHYQHFPELGLLPKGCHKSQVEKIIRIFADSESQRDCFNKVQNYLSICSDENSILSNWLDIIERDIPVFNDAVPVKISTRTIARSIKGWILETLR